MKKEILMMAFVLVFLVVGSVLVVAENSSTLGVSADIKRTTLSIDFSEEILDFGELTAGYDSRVNVTMRNSGTGKIKVEAELEGGSDDLFSYLKLNSDEGCGNFGWRNVSAWNRILDRPENYGELGDPIVLCTWLDLREYPENILEDRINLTTDVVFWVTAHS